MTIRPILPLITILVLVSLGCGGQPASDVEPSSLVVAEFSGGLITADDVDRFVLGLSPDKRWRPGTDREEWFGDVIRRICIDRILLEDARRAGLDREPEFLTVARSVERTAYSDYYLQELSGRVTVTEEELRAYYEDHIERFHTDEQREVSHIFKRVSRGGDPAPAVNALDELRKRSMEGESFSLLAREHSDSETRHNDGQLGLIERGEHSKDFDKLVFSLPEGIPSEPVVTTGGVHIFLVTKILEESSFEFDEVRMMLRQELAEERRGQRLVEAAETLPAPDNTVDVTLEVLVQVFRSGDPERLLLRVGDFELTAGEFMTLLMERQRQLGLRNRLDVPIRLLEELEAREIIYQHHRAQGLPQIEADKLTDARNAELVLFSARRRMAASVAERPEILRRHYKDNRMRFASPALAHIRRLTVPMGDDPVQRMARLESAVAALDDGTLSLEDLARELAAKLDDLGYLTVAQLTVIDPRAVNFVFTLSPGKHSPPYRLGDLLVIFRVMAHREPEPRSYDQVVDLVARDYLTNHGPRLFDELGDELLTEADFRLHRDRLAGIGRVNPAAVD